MEAQDWKELALVVLGWLLGMFSAVMIERMRLAEEDKHKRAYLKTVLREEVANVIAYVEEMKGDAAKHRLWRTPSFEELRLMRQRFDTSQEWLFYFKEPELRVPLFKWYRDISAVATLGLSINADLAKRPGIPVTWIDTDIMAIELASQIEEVLKDGGRLLEQIDARRD